MLQPAFIRVSELQSPTQPLTSQVSLQLPLVKVEVKLDFIVPLSMSVRFQKTLRSVTTS